MTSREPILEVVGATKCFGGLEANKHVSLTVNRQEIVGLIGPNGSGKSVLFESIAGQHKLDEGNIFFESSPLTGLSTGEIARLGLLRVFQQTQIYGKMSCLENMRISVADRTQRFVDLFRPYPRDIDERACALLDLVGLASKRNTRANELSFGQRKLLEISMSLMNEPKMLLLDEPTAGINPALIEVVMEHLQRANTELGITLLVIEHNMRVIMDFSDRIYCIVRGEILAEGKPARICNDEAVIAAYLGT